MTSRTRRTLSSLLAAATLCSLVGCTSGESQRPETTTAPTAADSQVAWSNVWSASPGINMFARDAELVRATVEAGYLAQARGDGRSFPGYAEAIGPQLFRYGDPRREAKNFGYAYEGSEPRAPRLTVLNYHIADLSQDATSVTATVCGYGLTPFPSEAAKYLDQAVFVSLQKPATRSPGAVGVADTGKNAPGVAGKIPTWNVFVPWSITESHFAAPDEVPASCTAWWKSVFPDAVKSRTSNQMVRQSGGPIAPDTRQYPRWLGPSRTE